MPEKKLNDIPRPMIELFNKGNSALNTGNVDYALTILMQILQKEPGYYECREALRAAQARKAGQSSGIFRKVMGSASGAANLAKGSMALRNNPLDAIVLAENVLNGDSDNISPTSSSLKPPSPPTCPRPRSSRSTCSNAPTARTSR